MAASPNAENKRGYLLVAWWALVLPVVIVSMQMFLEVVVGLSLLPRIPSALWMVIYLVVPPLFLMTAGSVSVALANLEGRDRWRYLRLTVYIVALWLVALMWPVHT